jgi:hypothetical protein
MTAARSFAPSDFTLQASTWVAGDNPTYRTDRSGEAGHLWLYLASLILTDIVAVVRLYLIRFIAFPSYD